MWVLLIFILGLVAGSFLGAFTYRLPRGIGITSGRSFCPKCKKKIAWSDNIPVLSYFLLSGKCRRCNRKISLRYPLTELGTAVVFVLVYCLFERGELGKLGGLGVLNFLTLPYFLFVASILIAVFVTDFEHRIIPDELVFVTFGLVLVILVLFAPNMFYINVLSGLVVSLFLLILHLVTLGRGMGLGDVKLALLGGTFLGWQLTIVWQFLSFLTGAVVGIFLILIGKAKLGKQIAFGPFLVVSFFITLLGGSVLLEIFFPFLIK
jgi:leader peptidase (prepilin peptidase)/N-methyltransferase